MYLYVDNRDATQTQVPKIKAISKLNLGGIPQHGHDCLANSVRKFQRTFVILLYYFAFNCTAILTGP